MRNFTPSPPRWRLLRPLLFTVIIISLFFSYIFLKSRPDTQLYRTLYENEIKQSRNLLRNARNSKYVLFRQLQGAGLNNQAQEVLLYHHLALQTSRVYLYQPIVWQPRGRHSLIPLSAFMSGVTKNSVSAAVFQEACAEEATEHVTINVDHQSVWSHAKDILNGGEKCIVVDDWILNWDFLASPGLHSVWPTFQIYLFNHFQWSEQIQNLVNRTSSDLNLRSKPSGSDGDPYLALHLRRGDFEGHCHSLVVKHTGFTTWATLPILHSSIFPPSLNPDNGTSLIEHCYPTLERILAAIDSQVRSKSHLRTIHVLHDGAWDHPLVYAQFYRLKTALTNPARAKMVGWESGPMKRVTHSGMVPSRWGEADWSVAVDVELARRADVFVGIGYSSLSTQVVALRLGADMGRVEDITLL